MFPMIHCFSRLSTNIHTSFFYCSVAALTHRAADPSGASVIAVTAPSWLQVGGGSTAGLVAGLIRLPGELPADANGLTALHLCQNQAIQ